MKINISSSHKNVPIELAESGKAFAVTVDMKADSANSIGNALCDLWNNSVAVMREESGTGKRELIRIGGGSFHTVVVGSLLSHSLILTEVKELNVVI